MGPRSVASVKRGSPCVASAASALSTDALARSTTPLARSTNAPALRLYRSLDFVSDEEFTYMSLAVRVPPSTS